MISQALRSAACDYRWLRDRNYPEQGSIRLVGDRYRLSKDERHILFRGVDSRDNAYQRRCRLIGPSDVQARLDASGTSTLLIGVDGYNVILTIANYLRGIPVFLSDDGLLRDIGGLHGRVHDHGTMRRAVALLLETIDQTVAASFVEPLAKIVPSGDATAPPFHLRFVLDAPVSHSATHAGWIREETDTYELPSAIDIVPSADDALIHDPPHILSTSDSALIDRTESAIFDLAYYVLTRHFAPEFDSFDDLS